MGPTADVDAEVSFSYSLNSTPAVLLCVASRQQHRPLLLRRVRRAFVVATCRLGLKCGRKAANEGNTRVRGTRTALVV